MDYITLSNGVKMPQLGYGVFQVTQEECERCVLDALKAGYRAIDTRLNNCEISVAIAAPFIAIQGNLNFPNISR